MVATKAECNLGEANALRLAIVLFIFTVTELFARFATFKWPWINDRLRDSFEAWWMRLSVSDYSQVIDLVDLFFVRCVDRVFGKHIFSSRAFAAAALSSAAGFLGALKLGTYLLIREMPAPKGAIEYVPLNNSLIAFWRMMPDAVIRGIAVGWALTLISIALTRGAASRVPRTSVWDQVWNLFANIAIVFVFGLFVIGAYTTRESFPGAILDPFQALSSLRLDYSQGQVVLLYLFLALGCALPVAMRIGSILFSIIAKSLHAPLFNIADKVLTFLDDKKIGFLDLIAVACSTAVALTEAFLRFIVRS